MGRRGPKPEPIELRALKGETRPSQVNREAPRPQRGPKPPTVPAWLDLDAAKHWRRLAPICWRMGVLTEADLEMFGLMCDALARAIRAHEIVVDEGQTIETDKGTIAHPATRNHRDYATLFKQLAMEFGLSPSSRTTIVARGLEAVDDDDLFGL